MINNGTNGLVVLLSKMKLTTLVDLKFLSVFFIGLVSAEIVEIDDGLIQGTTFTSRLGRPFHAFMRIPFAQPPINDLRFQAPLPAKPWKGVLNATYYGPICYQNKPEQKTRMSEDCLQINVFSPNLNASLPVIVYIFAGGLVEGSGEDQGRPHYLMDRNVVVANFNHRLGALGFLAVGTAEVPGNAGMKDQILALKWVQRNIAKFGGNPNSVTIVGLSSGAICATSHMLSPMAKGLFHRVVAMSGVVGLVTSKITKDTELDAAKRLATSVSCTDTSDINKMLKCLREVRCILFFSLSGSV